MPIEPWYLSVVPRAPDDRELAVLRFLLDHDFPGADALHSEVALIRVRPSCGCGCASIALIPPGVDLQIGADAPAKPVSLKITVLGSDGGPPGGMILWEADGHLADLEVYSVGDDPIAEMPDVGRLVVEPED